MTSEEKKRIVHELHKPARKNFNRRHTIIKGFGDLFQVDLAEMQNYAKQNKGYRYILVVIDCYSKYVWTKPLKNKTGLEVSKAMKSVLTREGYSPRNLQSDHGTEMYNSHFKKLMREHSINHYSTYSTKKAAIVERVIRTLKSIIYKEFSLSGKHDWLSILDKVANKYNNTKHRTIGMKPSQVTSKTKLTVFNIPKIAPKRSKFKVGDIVRISKHKGVFDKGYDINWSPELFKIYKIKISMPVTYLLKDLQDSPILGSFYETEIQKTSQPNTYLVEKITGQRKRNGVKQLQVKWLGFKDSSWIDKKDLL